MAATDRQEATACVQNHGSDLIVDAASSVSATIQQQLEISKAIPRFGANPRSRNRLGKAGALKYRPRA
jgi:hypothetical protein